MSRIDKAIELAARISTPEQGPVDTEAERPVFAPVVSSAVTPLNVTNPLLVTINEPYGMVTEEYNKLRALVLRLTSCEPMKNTLLVTSAVPNEGKTLTAVNLALSMARSTDHTVLLIDADFRRPSIHKLFDITEGRGFVHCLRDNLSFEQALVKTGLGKLVILPAGEQVDDPLELISSKRMQRLVQEIKERYPNRYVIFDSPPVLPFADARVMGALMDNTIFVTRENHSRINQVKEGLDTLTDSNLLGVLCNDATSTIGSNYGSYY